MLCGKSLSRDKLQFQVHSDQTFTNSTHTQEKGGTPHLNSDSWKMIWISFNSCQLKIIFLLSRVWISIWTLNVRICGRKKQLTPTFYADNMLAYLLGQERVRHQFYQVVDGVDAWMDRLESLDLLSDGEGVGHVGQIVLMISHAVLQARLERLESQRKWSLKFLSESSLGVRYSRTLCRELSRWHQL